MAVMSMSVDPQRHETLGVRDPRQPQSRQVSVMALEPCFVASPVRLSPPQEPQTISMLRLSCASATD
jgi:hypothetical protein